MLVLEGLLGLHRTVPLQLLQHYWSGHEGEVAESCPTLCDPMDCSLPGSSGQDIDLDYHDIQWFALETEIILSFLRLHPSTAFRTLLLTMRATPFHLRDSCPQ